MSLIPGVGNAYAQASANKTNLQMQREANKANMMINEANLDFQREMWNKEVAYNKEMWNAQNEYNSASAQRQRLEAAGLNPYMMMNGGDAGTASSSSAPSASAPSQIPMQAARVQAVTAADFGNQVLDMITKVGALARMKADTQSIQLGNQYYGAHMDSVIKETLARTKGQDISNWINDNSKENQAVEKRLGMHALGQAIENARRDYDLKVTGQQLKELEKRFADETFEARVKAVNLRNDLTFAEKKAALKRAALDELRANNMPHFSEEQRQKLADSLASQWVIYDDEFSKYMGYADRILNTVSSAMELFNPFRFFGRKGKGPSLQDMNPSKRSYGMTQMPNWTY